jgi:hypothetical protein
VSVPDSDSLDLTTGMTLEAWVRPTATGRAWRSAILKERASGLSYGLFANDERGRASGRVRIKSEYGTQGGDGLLLNRWSHLAATYDGSVLRVYVNGALESSRTVGGAIDVGSGLLKIGEGFKGKIDDVRVWRTALSAAAVQAETRADATVVAEATSKTRSRRARD